MSRDIKYVETKTQHMWECPSEYCPAKFDKITKKKWDSFTLKERLAFADTVFQKAEDHDCS